MWNYCVCLFKLIARLNTLHTKRPFLQNEDLNWGKHQQAVESHRAEYDSVQILNNQEGVGVIENPGNTIMKDASSKPVSSPYYEFDVVSFNLLAPVYKRLPVKDPFTGRRYRESGKKLRSVFCFIFNFRTLPYCICFWSCFFRNVLLSLFCAVFPLLGDGELWSSRLGRTLDFFNAEIFKKGTEQDNWRHSANASTGVADIDTGTEAGSSSNHHRQHHQHHQHHHNSSSSSSNHGSECVDPSHENSMRGGGGGGMKQSSSPVNQHAQHQKGAAIIALQEYWLDSRYRKFFEAQSSAMGYDIRMVQRTGSKLDAVAFLVKTEEFKILATDSMRLCTVGDRVALLLWLQHRITGDELVVANTHLSFPHNYFDRMNQVAQMKHLIQEIDAFSARHRVSVAAPCMIMGDFNVESETPVCTHLRNSGYYSCFEVSPPTNVPARAPSSVPHLSAQSLESGATVPPIYSTDATYAKKTTSPESGLQVSHKEGPNMGVVHESEMEVPVSEQHERVTGSSSTNSSSGAHGASGSVGLAAEATESGPYKLTHEAAAAAAAAVADVDHYLRTGSWGSQASPPVFVSHLNHQAEQVGVDHIFIKPGLIHVPQLLPVSHTTVSTTGSGSGSGGVSGESELSAGTHMGREKSAAAPSPSAQATASSGSGSNSSNSVSNLEDSYHSAKESNNVFVAECQVLPEHEACTYWCSEFLISDHRPVRAKIVFKSAS
jgi:endonuclease/exonuclease/phosphatase family metal-dependent hydrolase